MKLIRRIGPLRMEALKLTVMSAIFWFSWAFASYQTVYLQEQKFSASQIGLLNSIAFCFSIVSISFWSTVSDKSGSIKKVLFTVLLFGGGLFALVPLIPAKLSISPILFIGILPVLNFFRGSMTTLQENIQVRNCNELGLNYGASRSLGSLAFTIGSLIATWLLNGRMSVAFTFPLAFILLIPVLVLIFFVREPRSVVHNPKDKGRHKTELKQLFKNRSYIYFLLFAFLFYLAYNGSAGFVAYYMKSIGVDSRLYGLILAYRAFLEIPLLFFMNRLRRKFSLEQLLGAGVVLILMESILFSTMANSLAGMLFSTTFYGLGNGLFIGSSLNYLYHLAPQGLKASAHAFFSVASSAAGIIGSMGGGIIFDRIGAKPFYLVVFGIYLLAVVIFALTSKLHPAPKEAL